MLRAVALTMALATPADALSPPLPPAWVESGMLVDNYYDGVFGYYGAGLTLATYRDPSVLRNGVYVRSNESHPSLHDFSGTRIVDCASGQFIAIAGADPEIVQASLSATEFLRADVQAERPILFRTVRRAAEAVFGKEKVISLRETEETIECAWGYPELRPAEVTPHDNRTDTRPLH